MEVVIEEMKLNHTVFLGRNNKVNKRSEQTFYYIKFTKNSKLKPYFIKQIVYQGEFYTLSITC